MEKKWGLKSLDLADCSQFTDHEGVQLGELGWLNSLNLSGCDLVSDVSLEKIVHLPGLKHLHLRGCKRIGLSGGALLQHATKLQSLVLRHCSIGDQILIGIDKASGLTRLDLSGPAVSDQGALELTKLLKLQELSLSECSITDDAVTMIGSGLRALTKLGLSGCKRLTDVGASALGLSVLPLQVLDVSNTALTDEGVNALTKLKGLRELNLGRCPGLTNISSFGIDSTCSIVTFLGLLLLFDAWFCRRERNCVPTNTLECQGLSRYQGLDTFREVVPPDLTGFEWLPWAYPLISVTKSCPIAIRHPSGLLLADDGSCLAGFHVRNSSPP